MARTIRIYLQGGKITFVEGVDPDTCVIVLDYNGVDEAHPGNDTDGEGCGYYRHEYNC